MTPTKEKTMKKFVAVGLIAVALVAFPYGVVAKGGKKGVKKTAAHAAELTQNVNDDGTPRVYGWQNKEYFGPLYNTTVQGASAGEGSAADGGATSGGGAGATGGEGCSR